MATFRRSPGDVTVESDAILASWVRDARLRTLELVADLSDEQLMGPQLRIVNPLMWEIGHVTWFQEKWVLRHAGGEAPIRVEGDSLYDSAAIPHDSRWADWPGCLARSSKGSSVAGLPSAIVISSSWRFFTKTCTRKHSLTRARRLAIPHPSFPA